MIKPAILKPRALWTGKQLISNLISVILSLEGKDIVGFNMDGKTRLQSDYMAPYKEECQVIFRDSELL